ncbi:MAG: NADPH:quinone oxidoreductase family protein [Rhodobacter sp.]|nr:NADPH:quinone oxidoreductase family protein [Rhodobacter sp.]
MRAFQIADYGSTPQFRDLPTPEPGPGEVRVRVEACGLNFADLLMIEGRYQERPIPPVTLGMELAGVVDALGRDTVGPPTGTRVAIYAGHGGLATTGCFPAARCLPLPEAMPSTDAAGFAVAYGTSHLALDHRARLQPGETLVVFGAAGGVGLSAVEIGKAMGARIIAVARGPERLQVAKAAGADELVDSDGGDLVETLRGLGRADVVYDPVGGDAFQAGFRAIKPQGRLLVIGFASGDIPQIPANILMVKNVDVIGLNWGGYLRFAPDILDDSLRTLLSWYAEGRLKPHIGHVLPFEQAAEGLELLRDRKVTGKVVIRISPR